MEEALRGRYPNLGQEFTPGQCMHCANTPCKRVCPTKATGVNADGIVTVENKKCIGCKYCMTACPCGLLEARHFWYGSHMPICFIVSALASGAALTVLIVYFNHKARGIEMPPVYQEFMYAMGKLQALFLGILLFFVIWKIIPGLYGQPPEKYETTMAWITGPLAFNFWFFELGLGILIPLIIVANRRTRTVFGVMIAGLLSTIGIFFMRYDLVIAGQMVSMRPEAVEGGGTDCSTTSPPSPKSASSSAPSASAASSIPWRSASSTWKAAIATDFTQVLPGTLLPSSVGRRKPAFFFAES
ncbi:MAG: NrfD/PsrC family molybdoenzyme membrane anchor subunit [Trichloromonas sp.]|jgi:Pyruvate/2-oxoacid:ferredoxin oxidoreductase delta subunit|nr:NrfD/PsrC family molybdoenzyme membrane anchor subunit [Trichloromonas sp.]